MGSGLRFSIHDQLSQKAFWIGEHQNIHGFEVENYDAATKTLTYRFGEQLATLTMASADSTPLVVITSTVDELPNLEDTYLLPASTNSRLGSLVWQRASDSGKRRVAPARPEGASSVSGNSDSANGGASASEPPTGTTDFELESRTSVRLGNRLVGRASPSISYNPRIREMEDIEATL